MGFTAGISRDGATPAMRLPISCRFGTLTLWIHEFLQTSHVLRCPKCTGPMRMIALVEEPSVAQKILAHLGLPTRAPPPGRPWSSQRTLALDEADTAFDAVDPPSAF